MEPLLDTMRSLWLTLVLVIVVLVSATRVSSSLLLHSIVIVGPSVSSGELTIMTSILSLVAVPVRSSTSVTLPLIIITVLMPTLRMIILSIVSISPTLGISRMMIISHVGMVALIVVSPVVSIGCTVSTLTHDLMVAKSTLDSKLLTLAVSILHASIGGVAHLIVLSIHEGRIGVSLHTSGDLANAGWHTTGGVGKCISGSGSSFIGRILHTIGRDLRLTKRVRGRT